MTPAFKKKARIPSTTTPQGSHGKSASVHPKHQHLQPVYYSRNHGSDRFQTDWTRRLLFHNNNMVILPDDDGFWQPTFGAGFGDPCRFS
jgi:hypothetical protein